MYIVTAQITYDRKDRGITSMLGYSIPANIEIVKFQENQITHVYAGYFKNLPNLKTILLFDNQIADLDDFSFVQVPSVTVIKLQYNRLSMIRKNIFTGLPNLNTLNLAHNEIHEIQLESFRENSALEDLRLQNNLLQVCYDLIVQVILGSKVITHSH